jgi:hypothetical protein
MNVSVSDRRFEQAQEAASIAWKVARTARMEALLQVVEALDG